MHARVRPRFALVRRGYDPQAVDAHIEQLIGERNILLERIKRLEDRLAAATGPDDEAPPVIDMALAMRQVAVGRLTRRVEATLEAARDEEERLTGRARRLAEALEACRDLLNEALLR